MALTAGENPVKDAYWGLDRVKRMYLGDTMAYCATESRKFWEESDSVFDNAHQMSGTTNFFADCNFYEKLTVKVTIVPEETYNADAWLNVKIRIQQADGSMHEVGTGDTPIPNDKEPFTVSATAMVDDMQLADYGAVEVYYWVQFGLYNYDGYQDNDTRLAHHMIAEAIAEC